MTCSAFYDFATQGFDQWWFLLLGLSMGTLGIAVYFAGRSISYERHSVFGALLKLGGLGFALAWTSISVFQTYTGYSAYRKLLEMRSAGDEQHIQGTVVNFSPYDPSKHSPIESFKIENHQFSYSPNDIRPGYRQTRAKGSPIQDGVYARISSIAGTITRLEICQSGNP